MIEVYDFKLIKSGKEIEVYDYRNKRILKGYTRRKRTIITNKNILEKDIWSLDDFAQELEHQEKEQTKKAKFSISRTRTNIRRIVNANSHLNKFLTLTFAKSTTELLEANKLFNTAIKRIIRAKPYFEYIAVVEFQKNVDYHGNKKGKGGSVHYHLLCNIAMSDNITIDVFGWERRFALKYWQNGFVKIKDVNTITNMGAYFCKYLGKDMFDKRMFGKKKFFCSQTLNKPIEMIGNKAISFFNKYVLPTKPVYTKTFTNEYTGTVNYSAYTLK